METAGRLSPMAQYIAERLVTLARREQTVSYGEVAGWLRPPLDMGNPAHRAELSHLLGAIGEFDHGHGRPLLPAIVVYQLGGDPGPGFYELATRLDLYSGGKDELARLSFFVGELKRVYAYWRKHRGRASGGVPYSFKTC